MNEHQKKHLFKPGQSGNPAGRAKKPKELIAAQKVTAKVFGQVWLEDNNGEMIVRKVFEMALAGNLMAAQMLFDRVLGKVTEKVRVDAPRPLIMKLIGEDAVLAIGVTENGDE